ncbi:hypothetical protein [uncultured Hydrogenophaga sp.]|uniref:hypothetical protein n=1 Tax=uncultured Hydrogenophaga sp. TaxID=199683 RepID=UPI00265ECC7D|nr:hypothetical protein [uncultured Hydrogenophaga sp.]
MSWEQWFQDVAGSVVKTAADAKFTQPYEIQRLQLQALGQNGLYYPEGRPATVAGPVISSGTLLLIGGAVLVAVLLTRD